MGTESLGTTYATRIFTSGIEAGQRLNETRTQTLHVAIVRNDIMGHGQVSSSIQSN